MDYMKTDNKNTQYNLSPTFKVAQALFISYSTLQSNNTLENNLANILGPSLINAFNTENIREIYNNIILKHYPNELSVKSNFINQVLLKPKNHVVIFEMPINASRVDLCKINGYSTAFEIKTDLDNCLRLNKQLNDYFDVFEKVFVICSENKLQEIELQIPSKCGIYVYSISSRGNYKFQIYRRATISKRFNNRKQLNILRKKEIEKNFSVPQSSSKEDLIISVLKKYSSAEINKLFKRIVKNRYQNQWEFLKNNKSQIFEIDYQWFFKNTINPALIYS